MKSILPILLFLICIPHFTFGQFGQSTSLQEGGKKAIHRNIIKGWTEIESARTLNSASYVKPDGTTINYFSREAVNYVDDEGNLQPVSTIPYVDHWGWHAKDQKTPFSVLPTGRIRSGGISFSSLHSFNGNTSFDYPIYKLTADTLILEGIQSGIDKCFQFRNNGIKYSYRLNSALALNGDLEIVEGITVKDENFVVEIQSPDENSGEFVVVKDGNGQIQYTIAPVFCYDASGKTTVGKYELKKISALQYELKTIVDANYFTQSGLAYPVIIDPLITGPTTTWAGGFMPSCFTPNWNVDSILVTVPAQITVTKLSVTSHFYANPFTTTVMADGAMFFSSTCGNTTNFTVQPPNGNLPGTAYLDTFNMNSPILCCYPQNCSSYTFYLRMHLRRTTNGPGCNTTYLYYDPTSLWPFSAYVAGRTVENYGAEATVLDDPLCSDECDFRLRTYIRYGVPPFTITHPWLTTPLSGGTPAGCTSSFTLLTVDLTNPNCPIYCDTATSVTVPAPVVTDACGNTVVSWPPLDLIVKPTPNVTASNDTVIVCSDATATLNLASCITGGNISWYGHGNNGTGNTITDNVTQNTSSIYDTIVYNAYAELNGCTGDTSTFIIITEPMPVADFTVVPDPVFILDNVVLDDVSQTPGVISSWTWDNSGLLISTDTATNYIFFEPGDYPVCLAVATQNGCVDTICKNVTVLPLEIILPNVISPNGDLINDFLDFQYLEFFDSNHLSVFNRWGNMIYDKENYQNDWNASGESEGVYYFILMLEDTPYAGYFHLVK